MILCDFFVINILVLSIVRYLQELVGQEILFRDSFDLLLLFWLLVLGQGVWDMIDSQVFKEFKMEVEFIIRFFLMFMFFLVDDYIFNVDQKFLVEEKVLVLYLNIFFESFIKFLQEQCMVCEVGLYYVLYIIKQRNKNVFFCLLLGLVEIFGDLVFGDIFFYLFMGSFVLLVDEFVFEDFCSSFFDGFFFIVFLRKENVYWYVLWFFIYLYFRVVLFKLEVLQKVLEFIGQSGEVVKEFYFQFGEKLE